MFAHGVFRTERGDDFRVGFDVRTADQVDAVGDGGKNTGIDYFAVVASKTAERLRDGLGTTRKIYDQRRVRGRFAQHGHLTRQNGGWHKIERNAAHLFGKTGKFAGAHGKCGFRRYVSAGRTCAASGKDQIATDAVDELADSFFNRVAIVGDQTGMKLHRRDDGIVKPGFERGNAFIDVLAAASAVRDGNQTADQFIFRIALCQHVNRSSKQVVQKEDRRKA